MKKIIALTLIIILAMSLTSCYKGETIRTLHENDATISVTERMYKKGELIKEEKYSITYESPEDARVAFFK